jgi:hypothetical protein
MTALRELAERWKAEADIAAGKGNMFNGGLIMTKQQCSAELLQILDAEGDAGEAPLAWLEAEPSATLESLRSETGMFVHSMQFHVGKTKPVNRPSANKLFPLYTHHKPVRSGVVSDLVAALKEISEIRWSYAATNGCAHTAAMTAKAALENFAKPLPAVDGGIVITRNGDGDIVAVTRQDDEGHVLKILALSPTDDEREKYRAESKAIDAAIKSQGAVSENAPEIFPGTNKQLSSLSISLPDEDTQWCDTHGTHHSTELRDADCEFPNVISGEAK